MRLNSYTPYANYAVRFGQGNTSLPQCDPTLDSFDNISCNPGVGLTNLNGYNYTQDELNNAPMCSGAKKNAPSKKAVLLTALVLAAPALIRAVLRR